MCDTMVIVGDNRVLFAKNSDRDANEGQNLEWHPRRLNGKDATLRCTYIGIPDVRETNAVLLSRPFWIWGAEIGTNEHGVTIGNEAVFTKEPHESAPGLIGMDLLRLALERAETAETACGVITALLELYGQGGGCGHESKKFVYHNSFIVADRTSAFVLETAGRKHAIEQVSGVRSISNGLTIPEFRQRYTDTIKTRGSGAPVRQKRTQALCRTATNVAGLMAVLRDHGTAKDDGTPHYAWINGGLNAPCVHAGGMFASSQTTASWIAELSPNRSQHWVTGTSAPCIGLFKPVHVGTTVNPGPPAKDQSDHSLWWRHERFHRMVMKDPARLRPLFIPERDAVEARWIASPPAAQAAFDEASALLNKWTRLVSEQTVRDTRPVWTRRYWAKRDRMASV